MSVHEQIEAYLAGQPPAKSEDLRDLHRRFLAMSPGAQLRFLDGRNEAGKVVSNPNIGYGSQTIAYADGDTRDFYKMGLSANTSGISVYVIGLKDKAYLADLRAAARQGQGHRLLHQVQIGEGRGSRRPRRDRRRCPGSGAGGRRVLQPASRWPDRID